MEMANILLTQLRDIKTTQVTRKPVPKILPSPPASTPTSTTPTPVARIPPPPVQYPASPAPSAKPPPGAYGVPVPAEPQYAAPPAQVNTAQHGDVRQQPQARIPPPVEHAQPEMSQPPPQAFEPAHRPAPQVGWGLLSEATMLTVCTCRLRKRLLRLFSRYKGCRRHHPHRLVHKLLCPQSNQERLRARLGWMTLISLPF